jgi:glycosyltransferase involved in cell wall biosynthesis
MAPRKFVIDPLLVQASLTMPIRITHYMRKPRPDNFSIERLYEDVREALPEDCQTKAWTCQEFSYGLLPRLRDMWRARRHQGDINHVTGDVHYLTFLLDRRRTILTVHDLVLLERLDGASRWLAWLLWYWLPVLRSRIVITISQATRVALLASVRCNPAKVRVVHNPVSKEFQPVPRIFNAACPRILQIGTGSNKNIERVAAALEGVSARLVVIGPMSKQQIVCLHRYGTEFEELVGLSRNELLQEYASADMVVFASTYEGFGLPIVEAQSIGRAVVTSNIGPMPEVAGDGACLVDPFDIASIRGGVLKIINDSSYREELVARGLRNAKRFDADTVAHSYAMIYAELAGGVRERASPRFGPIDELASRQTPREPI